MNNNYKNTKNYYKNAFIKEIVSTLAAKDGVDMSRLNDFLYDLSNPSKIRDVERRMLIEMINEQAEVEAERLCTLEAMVGENQIKITSLVRGGRA